MSIFAWYAIHTKPRQEERAATNLNAWGIEVFLPRIAPHRASYHPAPLFPGYLFARFNPELKLKHVHFTRGVTCVVNASGRAIAVPDPVISEIQERVDGRGFVQLQEHTEELRPGESVVVEA